MGDRFDEVAREYNGHVSCGISFEPCRKCLSLAALLRREVEAENARLRDALAWVKNDLAIGLCRDLHDERAESARLRERLEKLEAALDAIGFSMRSIDGTRRCMYCGRDFPGPRPHTDRCIVGNALAAPAAGEAAPPVPQRCESTSDQGLRCGLVTGHRGEHNALIASNLPWSAPPEGMT